MHLSKLVHVLETFDEAKIRRLKDYVHSPYFKVPLAAVNLLDYLYDQHPEFPENKITVRCIARKYKNLPSASTQSWAGTELLHAIEHFIGLEYAQRHKPATTLHQLHGSRENQLFEYLSKDYSDVVKQLNEDHHHGIDVFYHRHLFSELAFNERDLRKKPGTCNSVAPVIDSLDRFHALKKLRYLCEAHNRGQKIDRICELKQINALLKTLLPYTNSKHPYVYVFVLIYRLQTAPNYQASQVPYRKLREYAGRFTITNLPAALCEAIPCIVNHCITWYNKGMEEMGKEYLYWQEWRMNRGTLVEEGRLSPSAFRNIVTMAVNHHSSEWLKLFIEFYSEDLPEDNLQTNLAFALGLLLYKEKKYRESLRTLQRAQARDEPLFNCVIRRWQWLCSYECDKKDKDLLENQLLSFTRYLHRSKKELKNNIVLFETFIYHASRLLSADTGKASRNPIGELRKESYFPGKGWMEEQYGVLKC
jgi:hypothetical protein